MTGTKTNDPYSVLGVSKRCSDKNLKKAWREQSKKWHPDVNPDNVEIAADMFRRIQDAYEQIMEERGRGGVTFAYYDDANETGTHHAYQRTSKRSDNETGFHWESERNTDFLDVLWHIDMGGFKTAYGMLRAMPVKERGVGWEYLSALCAFNTGEIDDAYDHIYEAMSNYSKNYTDGNISLSARTVTGLYKKILKVYNGDEKELKRYYREVQKKTGSGRRVGERVTPDDLRRARTAVVILAALTGVIVWFSEIYILSMLFSLFIIAIGLLSALIVIFEKGLEDAMLSDVGCNWG